MRTTTYTFSDGATFDFDAGPWWRRAGSRVADLRHVGWDVGVLLLERAAGHKRGDRLDYRLRASARDLLAEKSQVVRDEMEVLRNAIARAGAYAGGEEATRALHAVLDALRDRVPPDLLLRPERVPARGRSHAGPCRVGPPAPPSSGCDRRVQPRRPGFARVLVAQGRAPLTRGPAPVRSVSQESGHSLKSSASVGRSGSEPSADAAALVFAACLLFPGVLTLDAAALLFRAGPAAAFFLAPPRAAFAGFSRVLSSTCPRDPRR